MTKPKPAEQCSACRFYKAVSEEAGLCRRLPPQVIVLPVEGRSELRTAQREVAAGWWCGEFKRGVGK